MPRKGQKSNSARKGDTLASLRTAFDILIRLQAGEGLVTVESLADEQNISTKQVRRYLDTLENFGVGFESDADGNRISPLRMTTLRRNQAPFNVLYLTREELLLLYAQMAGLHHAGDAATRKKLWEKVNRNLGVETVNSSLLQSAIGGFEKAYKSYDRKRDIIAGLLSALHGNHPCKARYRKAGSEETGDYSFEPYEMIEFDGGLYVYVRVTTHGEVRMLAVERMEGLTVDSTATFRRNPSVIEDIHTKRERAFRVIDDGEVLRVRLRFTPLVGFYVLERIWHPTQRITQHPDGGLDLEFTASGRIEINRWINSWGKECEVLEMAKVSC